jgi:hypothetical protein
LRSFEVAMCVIPVEVEHAAAPLLAEHPLGLVRARRGAGRDHQEVVGELPAVHEHDLVAPVGAERPFSPHLDATSGRSGGAGPKVLAGQALRLICTTSAGPTMKT